MKQPIKYTQPALPKGFKKKFWIDSFGNTCCVIYEKDNRNNVVSFGVAWLNEEDRDVFDRQKGKAISYGRAYKNWRDNPDANPSDKVGVLTTSYTAIIGHTASGENVYLSI